LRKNRLGVRAQDSISPVVLVEMTRDDRQPVSAALDFHAVDVFAMDEAASHLPQLGLVKHKQTVARGSRKLPRVGFTQLL
jgi:hypothetical protein